MRSRNAKDMATPLGVSLSLGVSRRCRRHCAELPRWVERGHDDRREFFTRPPAPRAYVTPPLLSWSGVIGHPFKLSFLPFISFLASSSSILEWLMASIGSQLIVNHGKMGRLTIRLSWSIFSMLSLFNLLWTGVKLSIRSRCYIQRAGGCYGMLMYHKCMTDVKHVEELV